MKWSHVNHGSGVDQGKSASYEPTFLPLSHAANVTSGLHLLIIIIITIIVYWDLAAARLD